MKIERQDWPRVSVEAKDVIAVDFGPFKILMTPDEAREQIKATS